MSTGAGRAPCRDDRGQSRGLEPEERHGNRVRVLSKEPGNPLQQRHLVSGVVAGIHKTNHLSDELRSALGGGRRACCRTSRTCVTGYDWPPGGRTGKANQSGFAAQNRVDAVSEQRRQVVRSDPGQPRGQAVPFVLDGRPSEGRRRATGEGAWPAAARARPPPLAGRQPRAGEAPRLPPISAKTAAATVRADASSRAVRQRGRVRARGSPTGPQPPGPGARARDGPRGTPS